MISKHFDKNNLHHAYLIEGKREEVVPEVLKFLKDLNIETNSSDLVSISVDSFKIDDARNLKSFGSERGFSGKKKIFLISANSLLLEAQHSLLKMFEEPIEDTHFFVVVPDANSLLRTLVSRFYFISARPELKEEVKEAEKFTQMTLQKRIDFIKEMLAEDGEEESDKVVLDSTRSKALRFLDALEVVLHDKFRKSLSTVNTFEHFFKVRQFLRMPGSSTKTLMESVALMVPEKIS